MRRVIYAEDMEPITVVELSEVTEKFLATQGSVRLPVISELQPCTPLRPEDPAPPALLRIVRLYAEHLMRRGESHIMIFTQDEESALLLRSAFLPGQRRAVHEAEQNAFARGFLYALSRLGT